MAESERLRGGELNAAVTSALVGIHNVHLGRGPSGAGDAICAIGARQVGFDPERLTEFGPESERVMLDYACAGHDGDRRSHRIGEIATTHHSGCPPSWS